MGEKRVAFGTTVSRAIVDKHLPESVPTALTQALFEDGDVAEYLMDGMMSSIGVRAERMYAYGRDHYTHGLPSGQFTVAAENIEATVIAALATFETGTITLEYLHHGQANSLHIGWVALLASHGYNPATNQLGVLTTEKGTPVYLDDMYVVVPEAALPTAAQESLRTWGTAARAGFTPEKTTGTAESRATIVPTAARGSPTAVAEHVLVKYVWQGATALERGTFTIPITGFSEADDYYHAKYKVGGQTKYWMYRDGAGTYLDLDQLFDHSPLPNGSFFPFAYFRYNKVSELSNTTSASYLTGKRLVKYLGMDYDQVATAIDANPGIDDVEQAMLMMAVPATTTNPLELRYLWEFFNKVFLASSPDFRFRSEDEAADYALSLEQQGLHSPGIVIQDARFKMSLDNQGIYKRRKAGVLGPVGTHTMGYSVRTLPLPVVVDAEVSYTYNVGFESTSHFYRRQVSAGYYDEIQVVGMRTLFYIQNGYTSVGEGTANILLIPLDRAITGEYSIPERETLYARSLHYVFNSLIITKVKWYQTLWFQGILLFVAVVLTAMSYGSNFSAIADALAAGAYTTAAYLLLVPLIEYLLYREVFKYFVKKLGIQRAFVIAILAAVAGMADAANSGSVQGAPFAADLLFVSTGLASGIGRQLQEDFQDLLKQADELKAIQEKEIKALETAKELLENSTFLSPFTIFGEKPQDYYNRTVHSGNIGVVGIAAISSYVDQALKLPELHETLGETYV